MDYFSFSSPLGDLTLFEDGGALVSLDWGRADGGAETPLLAEARRQLDAYFDADLQCFDLPLAPAGTVYDIKVWTAMRDIPYGAVRSYGEVARMIGGAPRAVGNACGRNPLPIIVPCHRVVAAGGRLGGYSGHDGLDTKRFLLRLEGWMAAATVS